MDLKTNTTQKNFHKLLEVAEYYLKETRVQYQCVVSYCKVFSKDGRSLIGYMKDNKTFFIQISEEQEKRILDVLKGVK